MSSSDTDQRQNWEIVVARTDAWMPLYIGDYLADTSRLTTLGHGAYMLLIMDYWVSGAPNDDDEDLAAITKMGINEWKILRPKIQHFFSVVDGKWRHKRIDDEKKKAGHNYEKRSAAGKEGAAKRWQKSKQDDSNANGNAISTPIANRYQNNGPSQSQPPSKPKTKIISAVVTTSQGPRNDAEPIENIEEIPDRGKIAESPGEKSPTVGGKNHGTIPINLAENGHHSQSQEIRAPQAEVERPPITTQSMNLSTGFFRSENTDLSTVNIDPKTNGPTRAGLIAMSLRAKGIDTSSTRDEVLDWAEKNVPDTVIDEAVQIAKRHKPNERIPSAYLAPIVRQILNPRPSVPRQVPWWTNEKSIETKAREIGCWPARGGESWHDLRRRIEQKIAETEQKSA